MIPLYLAYTLPIITYSVTKLRGVSSATSNDVSKGDMELLIDR